MLPIFLCVIWEQCYFLPFEKAGDTRRGKNRFTMLEQ